MASDLRFIDKWLRKTTFLKIEKNASCRAREQAVSKGKQCFCSVSVVCTATDNVIGDVVCIVHILHSDLHTVLST